MHLSGNFSQRNLPEWKTGLDNTHGMGYKKRERFAQCSTAGPAKGRNGQTAPARADGAGPTIYCTKRRPRQMDTFEKIRALLAEQLDLDPAKITMESDIMNDFEADSLDIVDMVMTLEDEFGIEVPDDAIENLRTVGDVVNFVDSHQANG
jgi:acyl carrier protein